MSVEKQPNTEKVFFREAIARALTAEMESDPSVFVLGQDVAEFGGSYKETVGLVKRFGRDRVRNTPVAEEAIIGIAVGAAAAGMKPVAFITYMDFMMSGLDPLVNYGAKIQYKTAGQLHAPLVVKTTAGAKGQGVAHSQSLDAWLVSVPGLCVVAPYTAGDAYSLLRAAIRHPGPVVYVDHKRLFPTASFMGEEEIAVLGKGVIRRPGADVTIVAYSYMCGIALKAAEELTQAGIQAEVIDLRSLAPMDLGLVVESVRRTGALLTVEEGQLVCGVGSEICLGVLQQVPEARFARVASARAPISSCPVLEDYCIPSPERVADAARALLASRRLK